MFENTFGWGEGSTPTHLFEKYTGTKNPTVITIENLSLNIFLQQFLVQYLGEPHTQITVSDSFHKVNKYSKSVPLHLTLCSEPCFTKCSMEKACKLEKP